MIAPPCGENPGWNPIQTTSPLDALNKNHGLIATFTAHQANLSWNARECNGGKPAEARAPLRVTQALRFVKSGVLEIEYLVTNLAQEDVRADLGPRHEFPRLSARQDLKKPINLVNDTGVDKRVPASGTLLGKPYRAPWRLGGFRE